MSCNGCRVLRKRCSERCSLRSSLQWIHSPQAQAHATLFLAKFFGRTDLMFFISSVPQQNRPALFQSLLFEACGRIINPVNGAVGLLCTGNWHMCQAAVDTVLAGGLLRPLPEVAPPAFDESSDAMFSQFQAVASDSFKRTSTADTSLVSEESQMANYNHKKLLNLFV
ncbi:LOB domain-containing protein 38 [Cajanus cajan]|uniref:LOB domain-containing protein 38 n=1 Tax=Cajanus cajan TaxID=3821 RepID=A0A151TTN2_CAJCA|nr:LOB domain-containing protein 38 [Cajanus cajan]KYP70417.1 LOB domain-containing protein 38 [Cajanus cajan]